MNRIFLIAGGSVIVFVICVALLSSIAVSKVGDLFLPADDSY